MLIKPCMYFYKRYPATCKALDLFDFVSIHLTSCSLISLHFSIYFIVIVLTYLFDFTKPILWVISIIRWRRFFNLETTPSVFEIRLFGEPDEKSFGPDKFLTKLRCQLWIFFTKFIKRLRSAAARLIPKFKLLKRSFLCWNSISRNSNQMLLENSFVDIFLQVNYLPILMIYCSEFFSLCW